MNPSSTRDAFALPRLIAAACLLTAAATTAAAAVGEGSAGPPDPLQSPAWEVMRERFFNGQRVVFDDRVKVIAPDNAENPVAVPVMVDAQALGKVSEIVVIADLNPIQKILSMNPVRAQPDVAFRFKVEQSTPIRAAARTEDGVWHIGGRWLNAAGGGCTTASLGTGGGLWQGHLGEMKARLWARDGGGGERLRLRIIHPMDTGLARGIPAFYIDQLTVRDASGAELATLHLHEPVEENPVISLDLDARGPVRIHGHDIQGDRFGGDVAP